MGNGNRMEAETETGNGSRNGSRMQAETETGNGSRNGNGEWKQKWKQNASRNRNGEWKQKRKRGMEAEMEAECKQKQKRGMEAETETGNGNENRMECLPYRWHKCRLQNGVVKTSSSIHTAPRTPPSSCHIQYGKAGVPENFIL